MKANRFLVRGNFSEGNYGDDALLVVVQLLLSKRSECIVYDCDRLAYKQDIARNLTVADKSALFNSDYIVYGGGTQFFSFKDASAGTRSVQQSVISRLLKLLLNPVRMLASFQARYRARKEGTLKKIAIGIGFGPFEAESKEKSKAMGFAAKMDFIWVRDDVSEKFCKDAGVKNFVRGTDLCFTSEFLSYFRNGLREVEVAHNSQTKKLGIILRDWAHSDISESYTTCTDLASKCRGLGWDVIFYVFSTQDGQTLKHLRDCGELVNLWDAEEMSIVDYANELASCDSILTQRFHGAIFAILLNIPYSTITLEPKLQIVGDLLSSDAKLSPQQDLEDYFNRVLRTIDDSAEIKKRISEVLIDQQARSDMATEGLVKYLSAKHND